MQRSALLFGWDGTRCGRDEDVYFVTYIATYSGIRFDLLNPDPKSVRIGDIAHSLSLLCRFNGHIRKFYSVAEHCCAVAAACPDEAKVYGLLHDAAEAYIGDITRPLKRILGAFIAEIENRVHWAILSAFGVPPPTASVARALAIADDAALLAERRDLLPGAGHRWAEDDSAEACPENRLAPMTPPDAERCFLENFYNLGLNDHEA